MTFIGRKPEHDSEACRRPQSSPKQTDIPVPTGTSAPDSSENGITDHRNTQLTVAEATDLFFCHFCRISEITYLCNQIIYYFFITTFHRYETISFVFIRF